jgi:hypothetical protein
MNITRKIVCRSLVSVMTACAPSGYYDSNGDYRSYGKSDSFRHDKAIAGTPTTDNYSSDNGSVTTTTVTYTRPGYYDRNGYYIARDSGPHVSEEFLPPRGMCRVWFADRPATDQPQVESCKGIQGRVPVGAYVIYGG